MKLFRLSADTPQCQIFIGEPGYEYTDGAERQITFFSFETQISAKCSMPTLEKVIFPSIRTCVGRESSVGIATSYGQNGQVSILGRSKKYFSKLQGAHHLETETNSYTVGTGEYFSGSKAAGA
jgi:hypothetical protein